MFEVGEEKACLEFPSDLHPDSVNDFSSVGLVLRDTPSPTQLLVPQGTKMRREKQKEAKDIDSSSHGPDSILSQVPPESRPRWEQCPNMGSVG